jgi:hypothetical protein
MINLAREPYRSNMLELLRDSKAQETFMSWMVDEAGSSHSDVIAWMNLEKTYMETHGFDPSIWELWYPEYFASDNFPEKSIWLCKRYKGAGAPFRQMKRYDSLKEAQTMANTLNEGHTIMWARKKDGTQSTPSGNYFV